MIAKLVPISIQFEGCVGPAGSRFSATVEA